MHLSSVGKNIYSSAALKSIFEIFVLYYYSTTIQGEILKSLLHYIYLIIY